jgi:polysaccharide biosynthesis/export protein
LIPVAGFPIYMCCKKVDPAVIAFLIGVCVLSFSAQTRGQTPPVDLVNVRYDRTANYRIGPGDVIDVMVDNNELLTRKDVRVSNSGTIQLAMMNGEEPVACRTEAELANQIREKYRKYMLDPRVTIAVKLFDSKPVAVIGAVNSPGRFQLQRSVRLLELLTLVNGPSSNSGRTIQLIRNPDLATNCEAAEVGQGEIQNGQELVTFPLGETLKGVESANPRIRAGDIVTVLEAEQAYIYGNVKSAMTLNLREPVSLTQAIVLAGGLADGAVTDKIRIGRQAPGSLVRTEIVVNLKDIRKRRIEEVYLQPNDMVEIPGPTGTKKFLKNIFTSILPMITRLPVTVVPF